MSIYLTAVIKVKPEYRNEIEIILKKMVVETLREEACLQYDLHQGINDPNTFVFYEIWKDQKGLNMHNQQLYIRAFGNLSPEKFQEQPQIYLTKKI